MTNQKHCQGSYWRKIHKWKEKRENNKITVKEKLMETLKWKKVKGKENIAQIERKKNEKIK